MNATRPAAVQPDRLARLRREDAELRALHVRVRAGAMATGRPVDADGLAVVLGTVLAEQRRTGVDPTEWTEVRVLEFMWTTCLRWCLEQGVQPSAHIAATLAAWWDHLADNDGLHPRSDAPTLLRTALASCTGRPATGRARRTHPSSGTARRREHGGVR